MLHANCKYSLSIRHFVLVGSAKGWNTRTIAKYFSIALNSVSWQAVFRIINKAVPITSHHSWNSSMKRAKKYCYVAFLLCLSILFLLTPMPDTPIFLNIVTDEVEPLVSECEKVKIPFILNGMSIYRLTFFILRYYKLASKTILPSDCNILHQGPLWGQVCISRYRIRRLGGGGGQQGAGGHDSPPWSCVSG